MGRIRIAGRLALIVVGAIVLVQMLMAAVYFVEQRRRAEPAGFTSLLGQIAALTRALDSVPPAQRPLILRAATNIRFLPRISPTLPENTGHSALLAGAERRLHAMLGPPRNRFVALSLIAEHKAGHHPFFRFRLRRLVGSQLHAVVGLSSGGYLDVEAARDLTLRLLGIPAGLLAGILGFAVAVCALFAVRRETKPLSELAGAVERFGTAIEPQPVAERGAPDVRALVRAVNAMQARIVRTECEARQAQHAPVTLAGAQAPLAVRGSTSGLARVVANLISNALAYGGSADVSLHADEGFVELWVEDRGPGIPAAERNHVFEPFYRLEPSRNRESGGAGLGLTIVRQIVEHNRGTVIIEDRPGGGTRMRVRLPAAGKA